MVISPSTAPGRCRRLLFDGFGELLEYLREQLSRSREVEAHKALADFAEGHTVAERHLNHARSYTAKPLERAPPAVVRSTRRDAS